VAAVGDERRGDRPARPVRVTPRSAQRWWLRLVVNPGERRRSPSPAPIWSITYIGANDWTPHTAHGARSTALLL